MVWDFEGVRTREGKLIYRKRSKLGEPGGMARRKLFLSFFQERHYLRFPRNISANKYGGKMQQFVVFFFFLRLSSVIGKIRDNVNGKSKTVT